MEKQDKCEECNSRFQLWFNKFMYHFNKKVKLISKDEAFAKATYGNCMNREQFILNKQVSINSSIKEQISNAEMVDTDFERYFMVVPFTKTEDECSEEIFRPFIDGGYKVVKISDKIDVLNGNNVYLLFWKENSIFV